MISLRGLYAITDPHLLPSDRLLPACACLLYTSDAADE